MREIHAKKLPSGNYRIQGRINGERYSFTFDHNPTKREINEAVREAEKQSEVKRSISKGCKTFEDAFRIYIDAKSSVLSPSTIRGYNTTFRAIPDDFKGMEVADINTLAVQRVINDYSGSHSTKSTKNLNGLISTVMKMAHPGITLNVTLPAPQHKQEYIPTDEDIKRILEEARGTKYEIPFWLAVFGLRRSEILALTIDDLEGNVLIINKGMVQEEGESWVVKPTPKTESSNRRVYIPNHLRDLILERGCIYEGKPHMLYETLCTYQDRLGIPRFSLHKLRHYFASMGHEMGLSDADIMAMGGWKTDRIMKSVYRHAQEQSVSESQQKYADKILSIAGPKPDLKVVPGGQQRKQA